MTEVLSIVIDPSTVIISAIITITFSEPVFEFTNDDIAVQSGSLADDLLSNDGNITWTVTFIPLSNNDSSNNRVTVSAGYTDMSLVQGTSYTSNYYTVNTNLFTELFMNWLYINHIHKKFTEYNIILLDNLTNEIKIDNTQYIKLNKINYEIKNKKYI